MPKRLIIAEKPRVAEHISAALGLRRFGGQGTAYYQNETWLCVAARGHLLRLCTPDELDPSWRRWSFQTLPILPQQFKLAPIAQSSTILQTICNLIRSEEVECVINACDPGREGELIFREIFQASGSSKPCFRFWLPTLSPDEIRREATNPRPAATYTGLFASARTRAKADWIIGMNLTRAMSLRISRRDTWTVGRVQTPTLAFLYHRELARKMESGRKEYILCLAGDEVPEGITVVEEWGPRFRNTKSWETPESVPTRDPEVQSITLRKVTFQEEESPPPPPHLLDLQRQMNQRKGWTAKKTLDVAQQLYEKHRVISYPRTDCRQLPIADLDTFEQIAKSLVSQLNSFEGCLLSQQWARQRSYFTETIASDHHAIIPTAPATNLSEDEAELYDAVLRAFLALFMPNAQVQWTSWQGLWATFKVQNQPRKDLQPGEQSSGFYQVLTQNWGEPPQNPEVLEISASRLEVMSRPRPVPPPFTEATLLSAMERAGENLDNPEEERALILARGLGTAATRHQIIENLKAQGYCSPDLVITEKGKYLIEVLQQAELDWICEPKLSATLELQLLEIERNPVQEVVTWIRFCGKVTTAVEAIQNCSLPTPVPAKAEALPSQELEANEQPRASTKPSQPQKLADCPVHGPQCGIRQLGEYYICERRIAARIKGEEATGYFAKSLPSPQEMTL